MSGLKLPPIGPTRPTRTLLLTYTFLYPSQPTQPRRAGILSARVAGILSAQVAGLSRALVSLMLMPDEFENALACLNAKSVP